MPVTYILDSKSRIIHTICTSPLTFDEVLDHFRALSTDPACTGRLDVLLDVSQADALPESGQLFSVARTIRNLLSKVHFGVCSIVATRNAMFGMMRMFEAMATDYFLEIRVFRDAAEAESWLLSRRSQADSNPERP